MSSSQSLTVQGEVKADEIELSVDQGGGVVGTAGTEGYTWDFALVFEEIGDVAPYTIGGEYRDDSGALINFKEIQARVKAAGLTHVEYRSTRPIRSGGDKHYVIMLLSAHEQRLEFEADHLNYKQPLDPQEVEKMTEDPKGRPGRWGTIYTPKNVEGISGIDNYKAFYEAMGTSRTPFQDLFGPFETRVTATDKRSKDDYDIDIRSLYPIQDDGTRFDTLDRKRLILAILSNPVNPAEGVFPGCGLTMPSLEMGHGKEFPVPVLTKKGFYALHEEGKLAEVKATWTRTWRPRDLACIGAGWCWKKNRTEDGHRRLTSPALDTMKEYMGEKIALYFGFLTHYTVWLFWPALLGLLFYCYETGYIHFYTSQICDNAQASAYHPAWRGAAGGAFQWNIVDLDSVPKGYTMTCRYNMTVASLGAIAAPAQAAAPPGPATGPYTQSAWFKTWPTGRPDDYRVWDPATGAYVDLTPTFKVTIETPVSSSDNKADHSGAFFKVEGFAGDFAQEGAGVVDPTGGDKYRRGLFYDTDKDGNVKYTYARTANNTLCNSNDKPGATCSGGYDATYGNWNDWELTFPSTLKCSSAASSTSGQPDTPMGCTLEGVQLAVHIKYFDRPLLPFFAFFMMVWGTIIMDFWVRRQNTFAMEWGMWDYEEEELPRPEFKEDKDVKPRIDPITGTTQVHFPFHSKARRWAKSIAFMCLLAFIVLGVIGSVVLLRLVLTNLRVDVKADGTLDGTQNFFHQNAAIIVGLVNYAQIVVMGMVWNKVARKLNDYENHRTATQYEDSLILKTFLFQFFNNYVSFIYIAFVMPFASWQGSEPGCKALGGCMGLLGKSLQTVFLTKLIVSNFMEVKGIIWDKCVPRKARDCLAATILKLRGKRGQAEELLAGSEAVHSISPAEDEKDLDPYDVYSSIADYLELVMQFGYVTLFVVAFPLAPFLAWISCVVESRIDAFKLCEGSRRPMPDGARDIGSWEYILKFMGFVAVFSNAFIIIFDANFEMVPDTLPLSQKWVGFLVLEHLMVGIKIFVGWALPDTPADVGVQLDRQKFIVSKLIENVPDEEEDDHAAVSAADMDALHGKKKYRGTEVFDSWLEVPATD